MKHLIIASFLLALPRILPAQRYTGLVIDAQTSKPVEDCYVVVKGSFGHAITSSSGLFELGLPAGTAKPTIVFSAPGYSILERAPVNWTADTVRLMPREIALAEVEIKAERKKMLNESSPDKILDFELMHGHLVLLTAGRGKNLLKLCDREGKEIARAAADPRSNGITTDCVGNLQLAGPDSMWQLYYDFEGLYVMQGVPREQFEQIMGNCVAQRDDNYYFCARQYQSLKAEYYYFNAAQRGVKHPLVTLSDSAKMKMLARDYPLEYFLNAMRGQIRPPVEVMEAQLDEYRARLSLPFNERQALGTLNTQLVPGKDMFCIVNYNDSTLYHLTGDHRLGKPLKLAALRNVDVGHYILTDRQTRRHYMLQFTHSVLTAIRVDIGTGAVLSRDIVGTLAFQPKKVIIDGNALYYLHNNHSDRTHPVQLVRYLLRS
jgi:hypothetical protein